MESSENGDYLVWLNVLYDGIPSWLTNTLKSFPRQKVFLAILHKTILNTELEEALPLFGNFHGCEITAVCIGDVISEIEIYKRNADPMLIKVVRDDITALPN